ncbi:hypothetical protein V1281_004023 [Nitrobacteraceae bacterium AZCC 2161]
MTGKPIRIGIDPKINKAVSCCDTENPSTADDEGDGFEMVSLVAMQQLRRGNWGSPHSVLILSSTLYKIPREFGFVDGADMPRPARIVRSALSFSII